MGEKMGFNNIDNGFVLFDNYVIPRICLLNRTADVAEDGTYRLTVKNKSESFGKSGDVCARITLSITMPLCKIHLVNIYFYRTVLSLGELLVNRIHITGICGHYMRIALVIAVRYCAVRKQFGPMGNEEWPVIEYQLQVRIIAMPVSSRLQKLEIN